MTYILNGFFFLICFFSPICLSAAQTVDPHGYQAKVYFDSNDLEIVDNVIYIHLDNNWIETSVIRTDPQGFYIFETDITHCGIERTIEKKWKCPYCYHWWPVGQRCQNPDCPTNKW